MNEIIEKRRRLRREFLASAAGSYTKAGIVAVSYTHLDVYKRQTQPNFRPAVYRVYKG